MTLRGLGVGAGYGAAGIVWHRVVLDPVIPDEVEASLFLRLENTPRKVYLTLNGLMIGQECDPPGEPVRLWLPDGVLRRQGRNELLIAQWTRGASPVLGHVRLEAGTPLRWHSEKRVH